MSDGYTAYTREDFISKFGYDPDGVATDAKTASADEPWVRNHLKSAAVGVMTLPTDLINFGPTVYQGAGALYDAYSKDTKFSDEFQKRIQVEGADDNKLKHLQDVIASWRRRDPSLTDEQLKSGIADYQKSKAFEDFSTEQLSGPHYLAAKWRDTSRRLLGDERTEDERSWTESAAEAIGGAFIGAPVGPVLSGANAIARTSAAAASVMANPAVRGAVRVGEALTPLTIPYNATNVAINAGAGLAIDQGMRYAQGKSTAFTPTPEDPAGIPALAGVVGATGAAAAFVAAVRGRTRQAIHPSQVEINLNNDPHLNYSVSPNAPTGQAIIDGGPVQQLGPSSEIDAVANSGMWGRIQNLRRTARERFIDQNAQPLGMIRDIHGGQVAREAEDLYTRNTGAVLNDRVASDSLTIDGPVLDAWSAMVPEKQRAVAASHWLTSYGSDILTTMDDYRARIADIQTQINNPYTHQSSLAGLRREEAALQTDLQRLVADDPTARQRIPARPQNSVFAARNAFIVDPDPQVAAYRNAVQARNRELLDRQVRSGRLSSVVADEWHRRNPYYVQAVSDPHGDLTGWSRTFADLSDKARTSRLRASEGTSKGALREGPLRSFSREIPQPPTTPNAPETRITQPLHPLSAAKQYTDKTLREAAHTTARNQLFRLLTRDAVGNPSHLVTNGRIRAVQSGQGRYWFTPAQLKSQQFRHLEDSPNIGIEWENGRARVWEFGDPEVARAARMEPVQLSGLMKAVTVITNNNKFWTTGPGNAPFAFINAYYNTAIAMLTHRNDRVFGPISHRLHQFLPERVARGINAVVPDISSVIVGIPYYAIRNLIQLQTHYLTRPIARALAQQVAPFQALQTALGPRAYNAVIAAASRAALWADNAEAVAVRRGGAGHGTHSIDNIPVVRNSFSAMKEHVPAPMRHVWQLYTDILDSFHMADKVQYYTQNHAMLSRQYGGNIPPARIERLLDETRNIAGDMSLVPGSKIMQDVERMVPYMTQTKLGAYHLIRNMFGRDTALTTLPRMMVGMGAIAQSYYFMTHWNDESRKMLWEQTPEYDRYRYAYLPAPKLALAHFQGKTLPFSEDLYYKIRIPPDIAGMVAGTAAFFQMMGAIPSSATIKPLSSDIGKVFIDSFTPAMPPVLQILLAQSGKRLDPSTSETRGGNWIRDSGSLFRAGPNAESVSNLGEISNSTSLMMAAMFGAMGTHIAMATDVMLHSANYNKGTGPSPLPTPRESANYGEGLRRATGEVFDRTVSRVPEIPLVWQNKERYSAMTPTWQVTSQNNVHISSIVGMRNDLGKAAMERRQAAVDAGGIPEKAMTSALLTQIANDIAAWQYPSGDLGKLKAQQAKIRAAVRGIDAQYNMPLEQRTQEKNKYVKLQNANLEQQRLATLYAEQVISDKYGQALQPLLRGRQINMSTLDKIMRENSGRPAAAPVGTQQQPVP